jgi:anti-sigma regulatory factor (Ser/Thr protein kinase)
VSGGGFSARITDSGPSLAGAQEALAAYLVAADLPARLVARSQVVVEEVVLNALGHGGATRLEIEAEAGPGGCALRFADDGAPFDPATAPLPPRAAALDEPGEGGRGLLLVRRFASSLAYAREGGENRLALRLEAG